MIYKVVSANSPSELTIRVNELIEIGFEPIGSHQVVIRHTQLRYSGMQHKDTLNDLEYTQTMVKQEKIKDTNY